MKTLLAAVILLTVLVLGCSASKSPVSTEMEHRGQAFLNSIEIFGVNDLNNGAFIPLYHDIALAQICESGQVNPGREWGTDHGCIAVTLNRDDNDPANPFKPVFRWLDSNTYDTSTSPIFYVCQRDVIDPDEPANYRAPTCDAIYNPEGSIVPNITEDSIEVVVAYMVMGRSDVFFDVDWDIEITALQWTGNDRIEYWTKPPTNRLTYQTPAQALMQRNEQNPDIAYFHRTGDVYVAYTNQEDDTGNREHIRYAKYVRSLDTVYGGWHAQTNDNHNGFDPSIDVGLISPALGLPAAPWVAIAYTAQFDNDQMGYHVNITAWPVGAEQDHATAFRVQNPNHSTDAGLPCVDIAPNQNFTHGAALVYTQVTGADGFGPTTDTFVVRFLGELADLNTHILVENMNPLIPQFADSLYPSIAINRQLQAGDIFASLAFMGQDVDIDVSDNWHPIVANMIIFNATPPGDVGVTWSDWARDDVVDTIFGNYNLSDIPFQNPGVASAIVTTNGDRYWAAWNDRIEMEPPPARVLASWGFAGT